MHQSFHGHYAIAEDANVGGFACILETEDLDAVKYGSRTPMKAFESPFVGFTDAQVRQWVKDHPHDNFASGSFAIMDEDTMANKTLRVGCLIPNIRGKEDDKILLTNFVSHMDVRVRLEQRIISWFEESKVGTAEVYDRVFIAKSDGKEAEK